MRVGGGFTIYTSKVNKKSPSGLMYADPGDIIDANMIPPVFRAAMIERGELVRVPFIA